MYNYYSQNNKIYVNGYEGARNYPLYPNSDIILLDDNASILYDVTVDMQGRRTVKAYDIIPHDEQKLQYATVSDIETLRRELNEYIKSSTATNTIQPDTAATDGSQ